MTFELGYRNFNAGNLSTPTAAGANPSGEYQLDTEGHEISSALRVDFYTLPGFR